MKTVVESLNTNAGPMNLHVFYPEASKAQRGNAILVFQEAFGVNAHIRRICERLAAEGYVAAAPELFHRAGPGIEYAYDNFSGAMPVFAALEEDHLLEDARVSFEFLQKLPGVQSVSALGFCMGGYTAILAAQNLPLQTAIAFYGGGMVHPRPGIGFGPIIQNFERIQCPSLFVFGERDGSILPEEVQKVRDAVSAGSAAGNANLSESRISTYPGAGHGFFCEDRAAYKADQAQAAWKETLEWLTSTAIRIVKNG